MSKRSELREQFYADMLSDAWSAVDYWVYPANSGAENVEEVYERYNAMTTDDIAHGWQTLLTRERDGRFFHCGTHWPVREAERALTSNEQDGYLDYDDCVIDAVIQLALLGDLVYG